MTVVGETAKGIRWSSASQCVRQVVQLAATLLLARLLSPSDFGLIGMAAIVSGFAGQFHDLGTSAAVIQRKELTQELLSSIFWVNVGFGAATTAILMLLAPYVAIFYQEPRITVIIRVLSLSFCFSSVSIVQQAIFERQLSFATLGRIEICAACLSATVGIGSACLGAGAWSLVLQTLSLVAVSSLLLWRSSRWRPKMTFHWQEVKSVSSFSLNLTGFNIFNYLIRNADNLLIGKFLGAGPLGYYTLAYNIMLYPLQGISSVVTRVMFPAFSRIQNDDRALRDAYLKISGAIATLTFPIMLGLWGVTRPFVLVIFGAQWEPLIALLLIFAPLGMVQSIGTTVGIIYQAKGRTDLLLRWGAAAGVFILAALCLGLQWGIVGVAAAYATASLLLTYANFSIPFKLIGLPVGALLKVLWPPFASSAIMLVSVVLVQWCLPGALADRAQLLILVPLGVSCYLLSGWYLNRKQLQQILHLIGVQ